MNDCAWWAISLNPAQGYSQFSISLLPVLVMSYRLLVYILIINALLPCLRQGTHYIHHITSVLDLALHLADNNQQIGGGRSKSSRKMWDSESKTGGTEENSVAVRVIYLIQRIFWCSCLLLWSLSIKKTWCSSHCWGTQWTSITVHSECCWGTFQPASMLLLSSLCVSGPVSSLDDFSFGSRGPFFSKTTLMLRLAKAPAQCFPSPHTVTAEMEH